jgi:hypothetical protein
MPASPRDLEEELSHEPTNSAARRRNDYSRRSVFLPLTILPI